MPHSCISASRQKIVVLIRAGISANRGLSTFRDNYGLWNNYSVYDVTTPEGFAAKPNTAHEAIAKLEQ